MLIRLATSQDYGQILDLMMLFVDDRYKNKDADSFKEVFTSSSNFIYVAEDQGNLLGFATASIRYVIRYPRPILELDELFVREELRGKGIGKMLMEKVEDLAHEYNCCRIFVGSFYERTSGHKFYEALGYENKGYQFLKIIG
ncbi:GNAT family N-acetyltransferase [soil metagenome]